MEPLAAGQVVHAGTLYGNPLALAAASATIDVLARDNGAVYDALWSRGERLRQGLESILKGRGSAVVTSGGGPVFQLSLMDRPALNYRGTLCADRQRYSDFAIALLDEGILVLPDGRWYISAAHTDADVDLALEAAGRAAASLA
jgi:glutamate-1-semialdehyde 2,1-aminomutase